MKLMWLVGARWNVGGYVSYGLSISVNRLGTLGLSKRATGTET